jgi:hypothetical protein
LLFDNTKFRSRVGKETTTKQGAKMSEELPTIVRVSGNVKRLNISKTMIDDMVGRAISRLYHKNVNNLGIYEKEYFLTVNGKKHTIVVACIENVEQNKVLIMTKAEHKTITLRRLPRNFPDFLS